MKVPTRPWREIEKQHFTPEEIAAADRYVRREMLRMRLAELPKLAGKSGPGAATKARSRATEPSRAEKRRDQILSTVRHCVDALGGELEVVARLKGKTIRLRGV